VRDEDRPGAVCYRVTPELYLGYARALLGNARVTPDKPATYADPGMHMDGHAYLDGDWLITSEYLARPAAATSRLAVPYVSKDVNLVLHPPSYGGAATITITQDGAPLAPEDAGADVTVANGASTVTVDVPRMYRLVSNRQIGRRELALETRSDGVALYAFTFTSCVMPE
jgi:hypothetical protein